MGDDIAAPSDITRRQLLLGSAAAHVQKQLNGHGYLSVRVEPERLIVNFRMLDDVSDPETPIYTIAAYVVTAGSPQAIGH